MLEKRSRGEISEEVESTDEQISEKAEIIEAKASDVEVEHQSLESLELSGTSEGVECVQQHIETAREISEQEFTEGFLLFLVITSKKNRKISRDRYRTQLFSDIGNNRSHIPAGYIGIYGDYPLLIFSFKPDRTFLGNGFNNIAKYNGFTAVVNNCQIEKVIQIHSVLFA